MSGRRSLKPFKKTVNKKLRRKTKQLIKKDPEKVYNLDKREISDLADSPKDGW